MASEAAHILVIDDEQSIRRMLRLSLEGHGYRVTEARTAEEGLRGAVYPMPDIALLDLALPDRPGAEVLAIIREFSRMPVIVLTASASDADKIALLDAGADDYLTKPFSMGELLARIRVALRHRSESGGGAPLQVAALRLDPAARELLVGERTVHLTPTEYALLVLFLEHLGKALTREQIIRAVWGDDSNELNALRVHIAQLRKKLGPASAVGLELETLPGVGYRLVETPQ